MKKIILIAALALLSGCITTAPVKRTFPEAPEVLKKKCENLLTVERQDKILITDMLKVIVQNYALYHECSLKVDGWNEWYEEQKKIFNAVK